MMNAQKYSGLLPQGWLLDVQAKLGRKMPYAAEEAAKAGIVPYTVKNGK